MLWLHCLYTSEEGEGKQTQKKTQSNLYHLLVQTDTISSRYVRFLLCIVLASNHTFTVGSFYQRFIREGPQFL